MSPRARLRFADSTTLSNPNPSRDKPVCTATYPLTNCLSLGVHPTSYLTR